MSSLIGFSSLTGSSAVVYLILFIIQVMAWLPALVTNLRELAVSFKNLLYNAKSSKKAVSLPLRLARPQEMPTAYLLPTTRAASKPLSRVKARAEARAKAEPPSVMDAEKQSIGGLAEAVL